MSGLIIPEIDKAVEVQGGNGAGKRGRGRPKGWRKGILFILYCIIALSFSFPHLVVLVYHNIVSSIY
jgi:hypothetical protein